MSKFNLPDSDSDLVKIFLAVIRVDLQEPSAADPSTQRGADITLAVNVPLGKARDIDARQGQLDEDTKELELRAKQYFQQVVKDFTIVDYGLFA